jgi:hypothetical protein
MKKIIKIVLIVLVVASVLVNGYFGFLKLKDHFYKKGVADAYGAVINKVTVDGKVGISYQKDGKTQVITLIQQVQTPETK